MFSFKTPYFFATLRLTRSTGGSLETFGAVRFIGLWWAVELLAEYLRGRGEGVRATLHVRNK